MNTAARIMIIVIKQIMQDTARVDLWIFSAFFICTKPLSTSETAVSIL